MPLFGGGRKSGQTQIIVQEIMLNLNAGREQLILHPEHIRIDRIVIEALKSNGINVEAIAQYVQPRATPIFEMLGNEECSYPGKEIYWYTFKENINYGIQRLYRIYKNLCCL